MKRVIVLSLLVFFAASMARAQGRTVALQQGVAPDAYAGCTTATLWPKAPAQDPPAGGQALYLRGEHNRLLLKFDIPASLRGKQLARARLWVFLPKAAKENRYCEIMVHGMSRAWDAAATWTNATGSAKWRQAGGDFDARTPYHNGRPPGAADSVELYAPNHKYWHNLMHWLPVSVPKGGMWVPFNVTALAEKWLANPAANHGVMLMPVRIEDRRMPNPWQIDIPSEKHVADPKLRPKLELELAPPSEAVSVGMTHTLRRINPWSWRYQYRGDYQRQYTVELAGNDYEGFQVVVFPWTADLTDVRFTWGDLIDPATGRRLPKKRLAWYCQDMVKMSLSWLVRDKYFGGKRYRVPDPLVPAASAVLHPHLFGLTSENLWNPAGLNVRRQTNAITMDTGTGASGDRRHRRDACPEHRRAASSRGLRQGVPGRQRQRQGGCGRKAPGRHCRQRRGDLRGDGQHGTSHGEPAEPCHHLHTHPDPNKAANASKNKTTRHPLQYGPCLGASSILPSVPCPRCKPFSRAPCPTPPCTRDWDKGRASGSPGGQVASSRQTTYPAGESEGGRFRA
ncbi:hypothetical protein LCGC14_2327050, partial [marine sediment metagenome]